MISEKIEAFEKSFNDLVTEIKDQVAQAQAQDIDKSQLEEDFIK